MYIDLFDKVCYNVSMSGVARYFERLDFLLIVFWIAWDV